MKHYLTPILKLSQYNIKIIFGNKFMYFVLSAIGFYILTVALTLISDTEITQATGYNMLLVPSILLICIPINASHTIMLLSHAPEYILFAF